MSKKTPREIYALETTPQHISTDQEREVEQEAMDVMAFVPVMGREQFATLTGLSHATVRGMMERGHLPTIRIGKRRLINIVQLIKEAIEQERE